MENNVSFGNYGNYYDLFYGDKNYQLESAYLVENLAKLNNNIKTMLELGAGSGNYASNLTNKGFTITGIELSETMIEKSIKKNIKNFIPKLGDIRSFNLDETFDAAFAFFDVMCYLNTNDDILSSLKCVNKHLKANGIFIFDTWHTSGVYTSLPAIRVKRVENNQIHLVRIATPEINFGNNIVTVNYEFILTDKITNQNINWQEQHSLRHFGIPEIQLLAMQSGFKHLKSEEMLTGNLPNPNTWKTCHFLQKL